MQTYFIRRFLVVTVFISLISIGCGGTDKPSPDAEPGSTEHHEDEHGHGEHAHPTEGPHGGGLIELGNEEYHGELIHDDEKGTVTIYILDSSATKAVPINVSELTVNLKHDGKGEQFKIPASANEGDPEGKSSRFVSSDKEFAEDLDREGAEAQLVVTIAGKQYRGQIEHDHEGHDHEHE